MILSSGIHVKAKYGPEFFSVIGRKGGEAVLKERGTNFLSDIGRKGGLESGKVR